MWLIIGLIVGAAVLTLIMWLRNKDMETRWYDWVIGAIGLLLLIFTVQNFIGSNTELEPTAANFFLLMTGLPALILLVVAWQLVIRRQQAAG